MEDDKSFDLYGDLDNFDLSEQLRLKEKYLKELQTKFEKQTQKYKQLETSNAEITKQFKNLQKNFNSLMLTAKSEIERKNRRIETLTREIDDLCFRRGRNQENLNQRPSHQPEATKTRDYQAHSTNPQKPVESHIRNPFRRNSSQAESRKETPTHANQVGHHNRRIEKSKDRHIIVKVSGSETTQFNDTANDDRILKPPRDAVTVNKDSDIDRRLKKIRKSTETLNLKPTMQKSSENIDANKNNLNLNPAAVKIKRSKRQKESNNLIEEAVITKNVQTAKIHEPEEVKESIVLKESVSCSKESQNEIFKSVKSSPEEIIKKEVEVSNVNDEIIDAAIENDSKQMLPKTSLQQKSEEVQKTSLELKETNEDKLRTEEIRAFEDILFDEMVFGGVSTASDDDDKPNSELYENLEVEEIQNISGNDEDTEAANFLLEKYLQPPYENRKNPVLPSAMNESQNIGEKTDSNSPVGDETITVADLIGVGSTTEDMENPQQEISTNVKKFLTDFPVEYSLGCSTSLVNKPTNQWQPSKTMESLFGISPVKVTKKFKRSKSSSIQMKKENTDDPDQENLARRTKKETEMISIDPQTLEELSELQNGNHCDSNTSPTDSEFRKSKRHQGSLKKSSKLVGHKIEGFEPKHLRIESLAESSRVLKNALFEEVLSNFDSSSVRDKTPDESELQETPRSDKSLELNLRKINPVNVEEERIAESGGEDLQNLKQTLEIRGDESNQNSVPDLTEFVENVIDARSDNLEEECVKNSTEIISKTEDDLERNVTSKLPKIGEMRHENKKVYPDFNGKKTFSQQNTTDEAKNKKSAKTLPNSMINLVPENNFENKLEVGGIKLIADKPELRSDDNNRKEETIRGSKNEKLAESSKKDSKKLKRENKSEVKSNATVKKSEEMDFVSSDLTSVQENKKDESEFSRKSEKDLGSVETEFKKPDLDQCLSRNSPLDPKSSQTMPKNSEFDQNSDFENKLKVGEIKLIADESKLRSSDNNRKEPVAGSSKKGILAKNSKKDSKKPKTENKSEVKSNTTVKNSEEVNFVRSDLISVLENETYESEFSRKSEKDLGSVETEFKKLELDQCLSRNSPFNQKSSQTLPKKSEFDQNSGFESKLKVGEIKLIADEPKLRSDDNNRKDEAIGGTKNEKLVKKSKKDSKKPKTENKSEVKSNTTVKNSEEVNFVSSDLTSVQENKKDESEFSRKSEKDSGSVETEFKKPDLDQCLSRNSPFDPRSSQTMPKNLQFDQNSGFENKLKVGEIKLIADETKLRSGDNNRKESVAGSSKNEILAKNSKKESKKLKRENKSEEKSDAAVNISEEVNFMSSVQENEKNELQFSRKSEKNLKSIKIELRASGLDQCLSGNLPFDLKSCQNARVQVKKLQFDQNSGQFKSTDSGITLKSDQSRSTNSELGLKSEQVPIVGQKRKLLDHDSHRRSIKEPRIESHSFVKSDHIESYAESYKTKNHNQTNHSSSTERCSTSKTEEFKETPVNKSKISHSGSETSDRKRAKVDQPTASNIAKLTKNERNVDILKKSHPKVHSIKDILDENATDEELFDKVFKSPNKYSCVTANPLNLSDPSGTDEQFKQIEEDIKKLCTSPQMECSDDKRVSKCEENEENLEVIQQHLPEASNVDIFQQQTDHPPVNRDKLNTSETEPLDVSSKSDHNNVSGDSVASLNDSCKIMTTSSKIFRIEIIDSNVTNIFITRRKSKKKKIVS